MPADSHAQAEPLSRGSFAAMDTTFAHEWPVAADARCSTCGMQGEGALSRILGGRHWLALKSFGGRWWDLDSTLPAPQPIGSSSCAAAVSVGSRVEGSDLHAEASGSSGNGGSDTHHAGHATEDGEAAAAAAAVRHWLAEKVQQRDAKVFRITECPLASHPLPDARDCASSDM